VKIDLAADGALVKGDAWTLTLDDESGPSSEIDFVFAAGSRFKSLDLGDAAVGLAAAINADSSNGLTATTDGRTITVTGAADFAVAGVVVPFGAATLQVVSATHVTITLTGGDLIAQGDLWSTTIGDDTYSFTAPAIVGGSQPSSVDVTLTDDDAPGVLIIESNGSTKVIEPSDNVVLGSGSVTDVVLEPFSVIMLTAPVPPPTTPFSLSTQNRNIIITAALHAAPRPRRRRVVQRRRRAIVRQRLDVVLNGRTFTYAASRATNCATRSTAAINAVHPGTATVVKRTRFRATSAPR
jgi:hypothetical protein